MQIKYTSMFHNAVQVFSAQAESIWHLSRIALNDFTGCAHEKAVYKKGNIFQQVIVGLENKEKPFPH